MVVLMRGRKWKEAHQQRDVSEDTFWQSGSSKHLLCVFGCPELPEKTADTGFWGRKYSILIGQGSLQEEH